MKPQGIKIFLVTLLIVLLSGCASTLNQETTAMFETFPSQFLAGDVYILNDNQKIDGNIVGIGTTLIIEEGAIVTGDITLVGSNLEISGRVAGSLNIFAGTSVVKDSAIITGDINQMFESVDLEPNALVTGAIHTYTVPSVQNIPSGSNITGLLDWFKPQQILLRKSARVLLITLVTLLGAYLFKTPTLKVSNAVRRNLPAAWGAGLLTFIGIPIISIVFIVTICLSPVGLLLILALLLSILWGWIALSFILGKQLAVWFKLDWKTEPSAILGAFVLGILTAIISLIPCLGALINLIIASFGLGGVLLSRFGTFEE